MKIKKFVGASLPEALSRVKDDFGEDAVILKTRFSNKNGSARQQKMVEITAAMDETVKQAAATFENRIERHLENSPGAESENGLKPPDIGPAPSVMLKELKTELSLMREDICHMKGHSIFGQPAGAQLEIARHLVERGFPEHLAVNIVRGISIDQVQSRSSGMEWHRIMDSLISLLGPGEPIKLNSTGSTTMMLIGPAGSGKSSAAARLAFHFSVENRIPVTLITTDDFRADSREQIKTLANIIGCQFVAVSSPDELIVALKSYKEGLIIIDTTGASSNAEIREIRSLLGAAGPNEIQMVLPADMPYRDAMNYLGEYQTHPNKKILVTKLDQTCSRGGLLAASLENQVRFSYLCASREIPGLFNLFNPEIFISSMLPAVEKRANDRATV